NFGTIPSINGTFSWSPARDTMTFSVGGNGFPPLTNIVVRLTNSAVDAASGQAMYSPYELLFHTSAVSDAIPPIISLLTPTNGASAVGNLLLSGTASDNIALQKVEFRLDGGAWVTANGTSSWSYNLNSSNFLNGPHLLSARATDTSGNATTTN